MNFCTEVKMPSHYVTLYRWCSDNVCITVMQRIEVFQTLKLLYPLPSETCQLLGVSRSWGLYACSPVSLHPSPVPPAARLLYCSVCSSIQTWSLQATVGYRQSAGTLRAEELLQKAKYVVADFQTCQPKCSGHTAPAWSISNVDQSVGES